jgi:hypothetical protein
VVVHACHSCTQAKWHLWTMRHGFVMAMRIYTLCYIAWPVVAVVVEPQTSTWKTFKRWLERYEAMAENGAWWRPKTRTVAPSANIAKRMTVSRCSTWSQLTFTSIRTPHNYFVHTIT